MLAFSNGARLGPARAFAGSMGRMPAFAFLIAITIAGLGTVLAASTSALLVIKLIGAVYLVYVGIQILLKAKTLAEMQANDASIAALMKRDFSIAITNPKAIAIFTAFFPQFIVEGAPIWPQLTAMGLAFLAMEAVGVCLYIAGGVLLGRFITSNRMFVQLNRMVGGALILAGGSMALSRH